MGGNFCEKLEEALRIKFRVTVLYFELRMTYFEFGTHGENFGFDEAAKMECFSVECCVRGYTIYKVFRFM